MLEVPKLSKVDEVFPAHALDWMPAEEDIPEEFWGHHVYGDDRNEWCAIASQWFFKGLPADVKFYPKEGVDPEEAVRAISATLGSFAPRHQHKEAAVAFMLSEWFEKVEDWEQ